MRGIKAETMSVYASALLSLSLTQTLKLGWCLINTCWVKIFLWTLGEPEATWHITGKNHRYAPLGLDTTYMVSMTTEHGCPQNSPWFFLPPWLFNLLWSSPLCLYDLSLSLHMLSWHYHYRHLQLLYYYCHTERAQTPCSNNICLPLSEQRWKISVSKRLVEISIWLWFPSEINTPCHAHPRMESIPVSPLGTMQRPSFQLLRLTFFGIVFEFLPLLNS